MADPLSMRPEELLAHTAWVGRLAERLVRGADADDVAQQTLLVALEHSPRETRKLRPWLATVARRIAGRMRREVDRRNRRERASVSNDPADATDEIVTRASLQREVVDGVLGLAEPYRTTILLRFFEHLFVEEVVVEVRIALLRFRNVLHVEIEPENIGCCSNVSLPEKNAQ